MYFQYKAIVVNRAIPGLHKPICIAEWVGRVYHVGQNFSSRGRGATWDSANGEAGCTSGPLKGIRVIELAVWHNGGAAGYMLGDLGADVIKIEQPVVGDPSRGVTHTFGHSLEMPGGRALWFEMVKPQQTGHHP